MSDYSGVIYCTKNESSFSEIYLVSVNKFAVYWGFLHITKEILNGILYFMYRAYY